MSLERNTNSISPSDISNGLPTRFVGQKVYAYPSLTSTMDEARRLAREGAVEGTAVITDVQTVGRGRLQRAWHTPGGNIAISIILRPALPDLPYLIMVSSLAVARSIEAVTGLATQVKWPNDVLIGGRKVSGILIDSDMQGKSVNHSVTGIGINVNLRLADLPEIRPLATSLLEELGREVSRLAVVRRLLVEFEELYLKAVNGGGVYEEWRDRLVTLGRQVRASSQSTVFEGTAESVARDGSLLIRGSDGTLFRVVAGDVTLRE